MKRSLTVFTAVAVFGLGACTVEPTVDESIDMDVTERNVVGEE